MYHESVFIGANDHPSQITTNAADKTYAELDRLLATGGPPANTNFLPPSQDNNDKEEEKGDEFERDDQPEGEGDKPEDSLDKFVENVEESGK